MIVLNAGVPRSGTVLVNAIIRALFTARRVPMAPMNPHGPELPRLIRRVVENGDARHKTLLVHTHSWDEESAGLLSDSPHVVAFANYRDPRDVCVSLMRLHDHDFDTAAQMVLGSFRLFAETTRALDAMVIPYETLVTGKQAMIFQIARRLGFWPGLSDVARIDAETTRDKHAAIMEKVRDGTMEGLRARQNRNRVLVEDPTSLINDRHIQSGAAGRWRDELTPDQQTQAGKTFAPLLTRYGYD